MLVQLIMRLYTYKRQIINLLLLSIVNFKYKEESFYMTRDETISYCGNADLLYKNVLSYTLMIQNIL